MSIPDEAVDAAARALDESNRPGMWEHESEQYKDAFRRDARIHLEAVAPQLLAQGWDEGWAAAQDYEFAPNPYGGEDAE